MTNEEKYKTPKERNNAYVRFCSERDCKECQCRSGGANCRFVWLALEVEEKNPIPCPHCGGKAELFKTQQGGTNDPAPDSSMFTEYGAFVKCLVCGCSTEVVWKDCNTPNYIDTAIAIWNRRVK